MCLLYMGVYIYLDTHTSNLLCLLVHLCSCCHGAVPDACSHDIDRLLLVQKTLGWSDVSVHHKGPMDSCQLSLVEKKKHTYMHDKYKQ